VTVASLWGLLPPDVHVVLHGYPAESDAQSPRVDAAYRPTLTLAELETAGRWTRAHAENYAYGDVGDADLAGQAWEWDNRHAIHVLFGRAP
jgi:hypothetical protein